MLYTFCRFFFENMRSDDVHKIGPLRVNAWVSIVVFGAATAWFVWLRRHTALQRSPGSPVDDAVDAVA